MAIETLTEGEIYDLEKDIEHRGFLRGLEAAAKVARMAGCGDEKCTSCYGNQIALAIADLKTVPQEG